MVKGETGMLSLDVRTSVDKGVSIFLVVKTTNGGFYCRFFVLYAFCSFIFFRVSHFDILIYILYQNAQAVCFYALRLSPQRRVMFLKNDYFYTVINETPFRSVRSL